MLIAPTICFVCEQPLHDGDLIVLERRARVEKSARFTWQRGVGRVRHEYLGLRQSSDRIRRARHEDCARPREGSQA